MSGYIHPDIMALFTDDASRGVHSKNNVCAYRDECRANDAEIDRLRELHPETARIAEAALAASKPKEPKP